MNARTCFVLLVALWCHVSFCVEATHGVVASVNSEATDAGVAVLQNGGNAIDAAVAVALTLGVVDGNNSELAVVVSC
jgi:gamma-glutamyltranspeptidase/glutathione hydrolase